MQQHYKLLDSGNQKKLEQFGPFRIIRPSASAVWQPKLSITEWECADASFSREEASGWTLKRKLPPTWHAMLDELRFELALTDFGHVGIFPEHEELWRWAAAHAAKTKPSVLNLFAYSGGATLALARAGAEVCHLDASKKMVEWARRNAALNHLDERPIRWIVDDVHKFLQRELRRGRRYDALIMDPPSFGRGAQGEIFKIERDLEALLKMCRALLSERPLFIALSNHTPGFTPTIMAHLMEDMIEGIPGKIESGELLLPAYQGRPLPSGAYARWSRL